MSTDNLTVIFINPIRETGGVVSYSMSVNNDIELIASFIKMNEDSTDQDFHDRAIKYVEQALSTYDENGNQILWNGTLTVTRIDRLNQ